MKHQIKTISGNDKGVTCLICNTTHLNGKSINPFPSCKCGNISFFDITEQYVRVGFNQLYVFLDVEKKWQDEVLNQIAKNGAPNEFNNSPDVQKVDRIVY